MNVEKGRDLLLAAFKVPAVISVLPWVCRGLVGSFGRKEGSGVVTDFWIRV